MSNKFKAGDKVTLSKDILFWEDSGLDADSVYELISDQEGDLCFLLNGSYRYDAHHHENDFELVAIAERHVHHDMIVAWAANPSRLVEFKNNSSSSGKWAEVLGTPSWVESCEYRFKEGRVFPVTSLSGAALFELYMSVAPAGDRSDFVAVANAAIKQHILDTESK